MAGKRFVQGELFGEQVSAMGNLEGLEGSEGTGASTSGGGFQGGSEVQSHELVVFEYEIAVRPEDIDIVGHVNNVVYVKWMQDAAVAHSAALGWPFRRYQELGAGWVARLHQIEYLQPAMPGDRVVIKTWVADMKRVTSTRRYRMVRFEGENRKEVLLAVAHTQWAFIDFAKRLPRRIPEEMLTAFKSIEG